MKEHLYRPKEIKSVTIFSNRVVERKTPIAAREFHKIPRNSQEKYQTKSKQGKHPKNPSATL